MDCCQVVPHRVIHKVKWNISTMTHSVFSIDGVAFRKCNIRVARYLNTKKHKRLIKQVKISNSLSKG